MKSFESAQLSPPNSRKNKKGYIMESKKEEYSPDDYILRLPSGEKYKVKNSSLEYHFSDNEYTVETLEGIKIHIPIEEFKNSVYYPASEKSIGNVSGEKKSYSTDEFLVRMINGVNYIVKAGTTYRLYQVLTCHNVKKCLLTQIKKVKRHFSVPCPHPDIGFCVYFFLSNSSSGNCCPSQHIRRYFLNVGSLIPALLQATAMVILC